MSILSSKEKKEIVMEKGLSSVTTLSVTLVLLSIVTAICIYGLNERKLMAANIENAIAKGVDPLAVKCAYETQPTATCVSYALNVKK